ncbi:MAG: pterin-binding protein [Chloroflexi bacterium RBG_16_64_43]|nr:MAG: pterin-binding protein [Chloroflexi bacterium RBG_16_64_43]
MQTVLKGATREATIDTEGQAVIVGERINPTGRKKLAAALQAGDMALVLESAAAQVAAGAEVLDINVGVPGLDDVAVLPRVVTVVAEAMGVPICIDTPNPAALAAALKVVPGKPLVNSVNGEEASLRSVLPLVKDRGAAVIGLTMDDNGIPMDAESRVKVAGKILERAAKLGIPAADVIIDPLVLTVGADSRAGVVTLATIERVRKEFGVSLNLGASNVSFGLPDRHTINQAFLALAVGRGANCLITDPGKLAGIIRATDLLLGRDEYAARYIAYFRALPKVTV